MGYLPPYVPTFWFHFRQADRIPAIATGEPFWVTVVFSDCLPATHPPGYYDADIRKAGVEIRIPGAPPYGEEIEIDLGPRHRREEWRRGPFTAERAGSATIKLWGTLEVEFGFPAPMAFWGRRKYEFDLPEYHLCEVVKLGEAPPPYVETPGPYSPEPYQPPPGSEEAESEALLGTLLVLPLVFLPMTMLKRKEGEK
ncbi:hypothetical protein J7L60_01925 [Candidatus Bathyarchaeota archaeon]|nr:hypothetical protein [Candidatus Bathyarchaeota archaeon]